MIVRKNIFIFLCFLIIHFLGSAQEYKTFPMWNASLPMEIRIKDLVGRLSLEEKVAQMLNAAPAVPRLGIPAYDWWNEVLHGVARTPYKTTVFPQAIAMAATWDTNSLKLMAYYGALEGRAIYNKATASGRNNEKYVGLTYWTPNVNIFRDPRWGRGQETYGEDPFLTAKLGASFVKGLQGDDPKYLLAAACAKHFAVHSGPESSRHYDNFDVSEYDLWDTYLPAFKELVVNAKVAGVMCAYNALSKQPCCANDLLMTNILRKQWNFKGYVTSDCWALDDFFKYHKTHPNATNAAADALIHGTDLECGNAVYTKLIEAVKSGLVNETQIDESIIRLFNIRYRLGMFDPVSMVKYAQTSESVLESTVFKSHALKMAQQSIVLLKNNNHFLPINKNIKRIAVIGPNADNHISVLGNYNGTPTKVTSILDGIKDKVGTRTEVVYEQAINFTNDSLFVPDENDVKYTYNGNPGFLSEYFNNEKLEGPSIYKALTKGIDFNYSEGEMPIKGVTPFHFSARYTTTIKTDQATTYTWLLDADEGYRFIVNDTMVLDAWGRNRWGAKSFKLNAEAGKTYKLVVEYWQNEGVAHLSMKTGSFHKTDFDALAKRVSNADVIVFVGGISPQLEGEQMPMRIPGFLGGDRTSILLPEVQTELLKKLHSTGKPVVFVMMTGSAIATTWESANLPAILNTWYGGQAAGTAVADVLFGDYNPAGRLPVTFYKSDEDLKGFKDYSMEGRTYRYFKGNVLYPFGYGLSFTRFNYSSMKAPNKIVKGKTIRVTAKVMNTGNYNGDEVVQLYLKYPNIKEYSPLKALKGFQRITLKKGETRMVQFNLKPEDLSLVNEHGNSYQPIGDIVISIGSGQPDLQMQGVAKSIQHTIKILETK